MGRTGATHSDAATGVRLSDAHSRRVAPFRIFSPPTWPPYPSGVDAPVRPMETNTTTSLSVGGIQEELTWNYDTNLVAFTLLYYDYLLTLEWEVTRYWSPRATAPNVLFFLNRYGMLLGTVPVVIQYFWARGTPDQKLASDRLGADTPTLTDDRCATLHSYHEYFAVAIQIIVGVMLILRTYALYERSKRILVLMVLVASGVIAVGVWAVLVGPKRATNEVAPTLALDVGCTSSVTKSQALGLAAAWAGMGVFDCTIFLLTLYRALSQRRVQGVRLMTVLLRDGSIYFGVIVLVNLANILTFIPSDIRSWSGLISTYHLVIHPRCADYVHECVSQLSFMLSMLIDLLSISSIMISRLMLNLRDPALQSVPAPSTSRSTALRASSSHGAPIFSTYVSDVVATRTCYGDENEGDIELVRRL
ncbi:unnamed protein product [Mycena citricolor]|uniref:DUF6533 domain-containing protein n=1 Tax=Mycena citricolor TaxID=2018698 RepID=A0AAD2HXI3_9AGAR|nr:unnamed protein product [Mycena citricolor]